MAESGDWGAIRGKSDPRRLRPATTIYMEAAVVLTRRPGGSLLIEDPGADITILQEEPLKSDSA